MQFVDEVTIRVQAGKGGDGCMSFHRGPNMAKGGPDGGNGGEGGDILLCGDPSLNTLSDFRFKPLLRAANGSAGSGQSKTGASGRSLRVPVPCGTTVIDEDTMRVLGDITEADQQMLVARGGTKGIGNASFKSSTNRSPRQTTQGTLGEERHLRLQLKVLADVGLLGLPNAGKSTLISRISQSKPKIADYPFTTLVPNLGVVQVDAETSFVVADVPGLIAGASAGQGLGTRFLRHLSRSVSLLHLVDLVPFDGSDPCENIRILERELFEFSEAFREKDIWIIGTKLDALEPVQRAQRLEELQHGFPDRRVCLISAISGEGLDGLVQDLAQHLRDLQQRGDSTEDLQSKFTHDILRHEIESQRTTLPEHLQEDEIEVVYSNE